MKKHLCRWVVSLTFIPGFVFAQDKIETDRPTESQSAQLVPKGSFQAEIGFRKQQEHNQDHQFWHPNAIFRFGLLNRVELRLRTTMETQRLPSQNTSHYGLKPIEAGIKANLFQTRDTGFITTLYGHLGFPRLASKDHELNETFYRIRLLFQNKLTDKITLSYNVGREWDDDGQEQNWIYTLSPQFELSDQWNIFLETYATFQKGSEPEHYIDAGLAYTIGNNVRLDVNAGKGLNSKSTDYFIATGISFKL